MKFLFTLFGLAVSPQFSFAGVQFARCTHPDLAISVCEETARVFLKSPKGLEPLTQIPFDLRDSRIYANADRSVLAQYVRESLSYTLIDAAGNKFTLQCELSRPGVCR
jgi:hypothetical protein